MRCWEQSVQTSHEQNFIFATLQLGAAPRDSADLPEGTNQVCKDGRKLTYELCLRSGIIRTLL